MADISVHIPRPHPKQSEFLKCKAKRVIIRAGRRGGKAQPLTAKVYTPAGPILMGDIKIGNEVLTPDGLVAVVEDIFPQGEVDVYKISFGDGTSVECTGDHLWEIEERRAGSKWRERSRVLTTLDISKMAVLQRTGKGVSRRPSIPPTHPTAYREQAVPIDPYLLGVLIGNATMLHDSIMLSTSDPYILDRVAKALPDGVSLVRYKETCDYRISIGDRDILKNNPITRELKGLGLWGKYSYEKNIPAIYKYNSIKVRLEIVRGLLDTDGTVDHSGQPRFEQTSEQLARDFEETIQSLGGLCTFRSKMGGYRVDGVMKETRTVYRQVVLYDDAANLFSLPRKKDKCKKRKSITRRYIQSVSFVRKDQAQCIKISSTRGLYLTDGLVATHNTVGVAILALREFLNGHRVLYAAPTLEQVDRFWHTIKNALEDSINAGVFYKNETMHVIELAGTEQRIKAKTAWNSNTLRGDYADLLILDEWQLMEEATWEEVGVPMLLDNDGRAVFIYTPPALNHEGLTRAKDPQHAAKMYVKAQKDVEDSKEKGREARWGAFHFTSHENPHISAKALADIVGDMTSVAYQQEILAEDLNEAPGALWKRDIIQKYRVDEAPEKFDLIVVGVDPSGTSGGDEAGVIIVGKRGTHVYVLDDLSLRGSPDEWASAAVNAYYKWSANKIVAESNYGGDMVLGTIRTVDPLVPVELVHASRGKMIRAEPVAAIWQQGRGHMVGNFYGLEDQLCMWQPGMDSPGKLDAMVWGVTLLAVNLSGPSAEDWLQALKKQFEISSQDY